MFSKKFWVWGPCWKKYQVVPYFYFAFLLTIFLKIFQGYLFNPPPLPYPLCASMGSSKALLQI